MDKRSAKADCWFFDSPKNRQRFAIQGQLAYIQAVLLEGDTSVTGYEVEDERIELPEDNVSLRPTMTVYFRNGSFAWQDFRYEEDDPLKRIFVLRRSHAEQKGIPYSLVEEKVLRAKLIKFDNWQMLSAIINRTKSIDFLHLQREVFNLCRRFGRITCKGLLDAFPGEDPALIYASLAIALQAGALVSELDTELFNLDSELRSGSS
ncbi:hypothetical protein [Herbaspirillum huttiense]|uniref:Uncharacterized protein n=1 Tax=Herbaspirillum huttiense subsp. nephrolepidis TaxID=3075126 RepID=A0AAE4GDU7_9BURK